MIRQITGEYVQIFANRDGAEIRLLSNTLHLNLDEWNELIHLLRIISEAGRDRPA